MTTRLVAALLCLMLALAATPVMADEIDVDLKLEEDLPEAISVISLAEDSVPAKAAILMDQQTGRVLFEQGGERGVRAAVETRRRWEGERTGT